jgi:hypothetical protein
MTVHKKKDNSVWNLERGIKSWYMLQLMRGKRIEKISTVSQAQSECVGAARVVTWDRFKSHPHSGKPVVEQRDRPGSARVARMSEILFQVLVQFFFSMALLCSL